MGRSGCRLQSGARGGDDWSGARGGDDCGVLLNDVGVGQSQRMMSLSSGLFQFGARGESTRAASQIVGVIGDAVSFRQQLVSNTVNAGWRGGLRLRQSAERQLGFQHSGMQGAQSGAGSAACGRARGKPSSLSMLPVGGMRYGRSGCGGMEPSGAGHGVMSLVRLR
jgi:hypothetical protein